MVEWSKCILAHLQSDGNVSPSDGEDDEGTYGSNHGGLSEDGGELDLNNKEVLYFPFHI